MILNLFCCSNSIISKSDVVIVCPNQYCHVQLNFNFCFLLLFRLLNYFSPLKKKHIIKRYLIEIIQIRQTVLIRATCFLREFIVAESRLSLKNLESEKIVIRTSRWNITFIVCRWKRFEWTPAKKIVSPLSNSNDKYTIFIFN